MSNNELITKKYIFIPIYNGFKPPVPIQECMILIFKFDFALIYSKGKLSNLLVQTFNDKNIIVEVNPSKLLNGVKAHKVRPME